MWKKATQAALSRGRLHNQNKEIFWFLNRTSKVVSLESFSVLYCIEVRRWACFWQYFQLIVFFIKHLTSQPNCHHCFSINSKILNGQIWFVVLSMLLTSLSKQIDKLIEHQFKWEPSLKINYETRPDRFQNVASVDTLLSLQAPLDFHTCKFTVQLVLWLHSQSHRLSSQIYICVHECAFK